MSSESIRKGLLSHLGTSRYRERNGDDAIGWKIGFREATTQRRLGLSGLVASRLHASNLLGADEPFDLSHAKAPACEPELGVVLARDIKSAMSDDELLDSIGEYLAVIEIVDVDLPIQDIKKILAGGVFHRALNFGPGFTLQPGERAQDLQVAVEIAREGSSVERSRFVVGQAYASVAQILRDAATFLESFGDGEALQSSDLVILGAMIPPHAAKPGDRYKVEIGTQSQVEVSFTGLARLDEGPAPEINYNIPANLKLNRQESQAIATSLSRLAHELASGNPATMRKPPFTDELIAEVKNARLMTRDARSRQLRRLAKVLWFCDIVAIRAELDLHSDVHRQRKGREKSYESWRERVMSGSDEDTTALVEAFPSLDRQRLRALIRQAHVEPDGERARQAQTQLLRMIREAGEQVITGTHGEGQADTDLQHGDDDQ